MAKINTPLQIGKHTIRNRIAYAPTVKFCWSDENGSALPRHVEHYGDRAAGGTGLIVVEAACVAPNALLWDTQLGLWDDSQIEGHRAITARCHAEGAAVIVQIHHAGCALHPAVHPADGLVPGPSACQFRGNNCRAMTVEEIHTVREQFIAAAVRAQKAGYDGVQVHSSHGYLLCNFISPETNRRTDAYGGNTRNRCRLSMEIIQGIRRACGEEFMIAARIPGCEPTFEESFAVADCYIEAGVDLLQTSFGNADTDTHPDYDPALPYGVVAWFGVKMHEHVAGRVPVSAVKGFKQPEDIRSMIEEGLVDMVDICRGHLCDPNFANAVIDGTDFYKCIGCKPCQWTPLGTKKCPMVIKRHAADPDCTDYLNFKA